MKYANVITLVSILLLTGLAPSLVSARPEMYTNLFLVKSGTFDWNINGGWWWTHNSVNTGVNWTEAVNGLSESTSDMYGGFDTSYVDHNGTYFLRLHMCPASGPSKCTVSKSIKSLDSASVRLTSSILITEQRPTFRFPAGMGTIPAKSSLCYAFVDSNGHEWSTPAPRTCQDAGSLPVTPSGCSLNSEQDLNVRLGNLERGLIATVPATGSFGNVKKDISVFCVRDGRTTVSTTFQYTPLSLNGSEVISAGSNGLGVAVFYQGKPVGPSSAPITETFGSGNTNREFEFQAVRDPSVSLKDIPTGNFTASATMIMTQQ